MINNFIYKIIDSIPEVAQQEVVKFYEAHRTVSVFRTQNKDNNTIIKLGKINEDIANGIGPLDEFTFVHVDAEYMMSFLPNLKQYFVENNVSDIERIAFVATPPHSINTIHIDQGLETLALNFPVTDCSQSYTKFLANNGKLETVKVREVNDGVESFRIYKKFVTDNPIEVGRYSLTKPVMLNVKMPHGVYNDSGSGLRAGFSFRFKKDPWHLVL